MCVTVGVPAACLSFEEEGFGVGLLGDSTCEED